jgi:hypothetical protein
VVWPRCIAAEYRHDFPRDVNKGVYESLARDRSDRRAMN